MKVFLKVGLCLAVAVALSLSLAAVASAWPPACPTNHCPQALTGYTYVGTCVSGAPGNECLGWIYSRGGEQCHVPAEQGI